MRFPAALRLVVVLAVAALPACGRRAAPVASPSGGPAWSALDVAPHGKPKLVFISAAWSAASTELGHGTFRDPAVVAESARFDMVELDVSSGLGTSGHQASVPYHVVGVPTVVLLGSDGREVRRFGHYVDAATMAEAMRAVR